MLLFNLLLTQSCQLPHPVIPEHPQPPLFYRSYSTGPLVGDIMWTPLKQSPRKCNCIWSPSSASLSFPTCSLLHPTGILSGPEPFFCYSKDRHTPQEQLFLIFCLHNSKWILSITGNQEQARFQARGSLLKHPGGF